MCDEVLGRQEVVSAFAFSVALLSLRCAPKVDGSPVVDLGDRAPAPVLVPKSSTPRSTTYEVRPIEWRPFTLKAFTSAKRERRPVLVYAFAEWSVASKELDRSFEDAEVQRAAQRFIMFRLDATNDEDTLPKAALEELAVKGIPTILLFDPTTSRRATASQVLTTDELSAWLDGFLDGQ